MNRSEAFALSVGTRVRGKLYADGRWTQGIVAKSSRYGKGVKFDGYFYPIPGDCHSFTDMSARLLESLERAPKEEP